MLYRFVNLKGRVMKLILSALCATFLLSGCQLTRVEGEAQGVKVKVATEEDTEKSNSENSKFCPPGQAKKGKCSN
jgi:PBP1b-binding outer membrane lipoprotein LpoB